MIDTKHACPLCLCQDVLVVAEIATPRYYRCTCCALIFIDDIHIVSPIEEKARYDTHNNSLDNEGYVAMLERFLRTAVYPFVPAGAHALDFGSGPGPVLQHLLQRKGYTADIYDRYYAPKHVYAGKKYDLITTTETIEHVQDAASLFTFFSEHLKSGGTLAIMTQFYSSVEEFPRWWYRRDPTHIRFYHRDTFAWIAENHPFKLCFIDDKNTISYAKV